MLTDIVNPISSPPRKLHSKNPKVVLNLWQKLRKKVGKVALKLRAILHIFGGKILLWSFGKFWQRTAKQRSSILYRPNEVQKLDIFGNKVFAHDNDRIYCMLQRNLV